MNHQRHVIREAIVALLAAGGTAAGARVYDTPVDVRTTFPALVVEDLGEQQQVYAVAAGGQRPVERLLVISVTAELQQNNAYARARDQLLADVEALLAVASIPGVKNIAPAGYTPDLSNDGERPVAVGRQRFEITYITPQARPDLSL